MHVPRSMRGALELTEMLYYRSGIYKKATERTVDYFLTKPVFSSKDDAARKKIERIITQDFGAIPNLRDIGIDRLTYGNSFSSIHLPFKRVLRCRTCSSEQSMITDSGAFIPFEFSLADASFHCRCKSCKGIVRHNVIDYPVRDASKVKMVRWDPKRITIEYTEITGDKRYWLEIDPEIAGRVRRSDPFTLATLPWNFIVAIKNRQRFRFNNAHIYHSSESSLSGVNLRGWGVPPVLASFRNFFRLQVLYRYDEVMKMDYIVPLRIMSPTIMKTAQGNNVMEINLRNFAGEAMNAVQRHRVDGTDWNFFPFPVNYQAIGGEGQQLDQAQRDTIMAEEDRLLNVRGIPPELYRGSLTLVNAPVGLRLFEAGNTSLVSDLNRLLQWQTTIISRFLDCGNHEASMERVTLTDNLDDKAWRLNAAQSGLISRETGFSPLGIDVQEEDRRLLDEQMRQQREQTKAQQEMQMEQMSIGTQDADTQGTGGQETSVGDLDSQAQEWASQLLAPEMTDTARRQQLTSIRTTNGTLHALIIKKMDQMRQQAGTLGRAAGFQQMGIGQPKTAMPEKIAGLLMCIHQAFPVAGGDQQHNVKMADGGYDVSIFHKGAMRTIKIASTELDDSIPNLVLDIKAAMG